MTRSRTIRSTAAFVALAAWANVQAMACCLVPSSGEPSVAVEAEAHGCCPGSAAGGLGDFGGSGDSAPAGCGMDAQGFTSACCETGETAAVSAKATSGSDVPAGTLLRVESPAEAVSAWRAPPILSAFSPPDGSPPFLSLQRLLI